MRNYMLSFNAKEASDLRSALHIAVNLLAVSGYSDLLRVRQTANNLHRMMVGWGVPLHPEVLAFESKCHGAFAEAFKKEASVLIPKPEPVRWEVQVRGADTSEKWHRSTVSCVMKNPTRAEAYRVLRGSTRGPARRARMSAELPRWVTTTTYRAPIVSKLVAPARAGSPCRSSSPSVAGTSPGTASLP